MQVLLLQKKKKLLFLASFYRRRRENKAKYNFIAYRTVCKYPKKLPPREQKQRRPSRLRRSSCFEFSFLCILFSNAVQRFSVRLVIRIGVYAGVVLKLFKTIAAYKLIFKYHNVLGAVAERAAVSEFFHYYGITL